MIAKARGILKPYTSVRFVNGEFIIRVDCECNSEAWIEISLSVRELALIKTEGRREGKAGMGESQIVLRSEEDEVYEKEIKNVPTHWQPDFKRMLNGLEPSAEFTQMFQVHSGMQEAFEKILRADKTMEKLVRLFDETQASEEGTLRGPSVPGNQGLALERPASEG